jgi:hypothetical protein
MMLVFSVAPAGFFHLHGHSIQGHDDMFFATNYISLIFSASIPNFLATWE